nr:hypothetical protein [Pandoravirus belohorizontensis]
MLASLHGWHAAPDGQMLFFSSHAFSFVYLPWASGNVIGRDAKRGAQPRKQMRAKKKVTGPPLGDRCRRARHRRTRESDDTAQRASVYFAPRATMAATTTMALEPRGRTCSDAVGPVTPLPTPSFTWHSIVDPYSDVRRKSRGADAGKKKRSSKAKRPRRRAKVSREAACPPHRPLDLGYVPEDHSLMCLELLLSDVFDPLAIAPHPIDSGPVPSDGDVHAGHARQHQHSTYSGDAHSVTSRARQKRVRPAPGRKRPRVDLSPWADAAADLLAAKSESQPTPPVATVRPPVWALPRCAPVHVPPLRPAPVPATPRYAHEATASALAVICRAVGIDVAERTPLDRVVNALCSVSPALAMGRRPRDPVPTTTLGWIALMGNHDWSPSAAAIPALWAGRALALAAAGLTVVAPAPDPDRQETPAERVLHVLAAEAHMPWFAARVRAAVDETLGAGSHPSPSLFDALPIDVFLVASVDAAHVTQPYDIYVVPRIDLLPT